LTAVPVIELVDVSKIYPLASGDVIALDHLSIRIERGEFVAIMGPSGSGKSTLLNQIGGLDVPTSGTLRITGRNIRKLSDEKLTDLRLNAIGYIFQKFNLIPLLSAYENV
jgi:putative ABC transport system ATP-binding protein